LALGIAASNHMVHDFVIELLVIAMLMSCILLSFRRFTVETTPLQQRLELFRTRLLEEGIEATPCERGPGRAVSIGQMLDLWEFFLTFVQERNMYYLDGNIVRPLTSASEVSFAELVGPLQVEWFVSHFWGHPFNQTCTALRKHAEAMSRHDDWKQTAYWVCTFSNSQHNIPTELGEGQWKKSSFYLALGSSKCVGTCMVLDEHAKPLNRSWCLFEVLQTLRRAESDSAGFAGLQFCTSVGVVNSGQASVDVSMNLGKSLTNLCLQDATATSAEDKQMIDDLVLSEMGDFDTINGALKSHMQGALQAAKHNMVQQLDKISEGLVGTSHRE